MRRDLAGLASEVFDVAVVGGGFFGACIARDAAQRGLSVALVEKVDFASGASANSLKIVHGGLRALARGDLATARRFAEERAAWLRIAEDLVQPLPVVVPIHDRGIGSTVLARLAASLHNLTCSSGRTGTGSRESWNEALVLSRDECLARCPMLDVPGFRGGFLWSDAQVLRPERLVLSIVLAATAHGAKVANYVEAEKLAVVQDRVEGVWVRDRIGGSDFLLRARITVLAAGPWSWRLLTGAGLTGEPRHWGTGLNVVIPKRLTDVAVGIRPSGRGNKGALGFLFVVPWGANTLVGTWHRTVARGEQPTRLHDDVNSLVAAVRSTLTTIRIEPDEVSLIHWGRLPLGHRSPAADHIALADRCRVLHPRETGLDGLIAVFGTKLTMARRDAAQITDTIFRDLGRPVPRCSTAITPLPRFPDPPEGDLAEAIRQALREEMALTLADIVLRRTSLGNAGRPTKEVLDGVTRLARRALQGTDESFEVDTTRLAAAYPPGTLAAGGAPVDS